MKSIVGALLLGLVSLAAAENKPVNVVVDFATRKYAIPAGILGAQLGWVPNGFYRDSGALDRLRRAGFASMRLDAFLQKVFATETPDWSLIDPVLAALARAQIQPLIMVGYTPPSLEPRPNPCAAGVAAYHAWPRDLKRWSELATALVAHFDRAFPGLVRDYEIWNEPDQQAGMCLPVAAQTSRLKSYLRMFALAAGPMRAQAGLDHVKIRVGGPAISRPQPAAAWVRALRRTAGGPDFISYHQYLATVSDIRAGLDWDGPDPSHSLRARTLDVQYGMAAGFRRVQRAARSVPVYLDEHNASDAYQADCCRNHPVYAPLWNALAVQELLNSAHPDTMGVPDRIMYFAAQDWFVPDRPNTAWFCLMGSLNSRMDCDYADGKSDPYPQFYAYELMAGEDYLALSRGGYLAGSAHADNSAIHVAAWSGDRGRAVLLTNSGRPARQLVLTVRDSSDSPETATRYLLQAGHPGIQAETLAFPPSRGKRTLTISMPGYSVVGLLLRSR